MRALYFDGDVARVTSIAEPESFPDSALVRVSLAGVCDTDLQLVKGYMDFRGVLGHEFVGTVCEGPGELLTRRVVGEINFSCRSCALCKTGLERHCPNRRVMGILDADGAFAEYVRVPIANLHPVPDSVPDEAAVFAEPLAAAFEILEQVDVGTGSDSLVLGDGKLGLLIAQVLRGAGARVRVVGKHPEKLAIARRLGIETVLRDDYRAEPMSLVVDATGRSDGFECAAAAVKPRGTIVLKTTVAVRAEIDLAPLVINEVQVVGSRCGPFPPALRALEDGSVDVASLIHERVRLTDALEALRIAETPGALKVLIEAG
ncbi:MAG: alcohol dehydrogenase catalytic domain-containing protein [Deltaproteobacteria bacterium]|nr:alcohol dehydrogenase catalytic domain-containing protein [Deltaproteobacteria bacterium]MBW2399248.1 alcohol dehydrogenase catalytic domain-containing protein [Deltaproteobacteria bacterium]